MNIQNENLVAKESAFLQATEAICKAMKREGVNQSQLAEMAGIARSNVSIMLSRGNISVRQLARCLDVLGYDVEIKAKRRPA
jgi:transcriptional regulator with XRE-family HTH domain